MTDRPTAENDAAEAVARVLLALDPCEGGEEQYARHQSVCVPFHDRAQEFLTDDVLDAIDRLRVFPPGATDA